MAYLLRTSTCLLAMLLLSLLPVLAQEKPAPEGKAEEKPAAAKSKNFLILMTGSRFYATGGKGSELLTIGDHFGSAVAGEGVRFSGEVANTHAEAKTYIEKNAPAFGLVTPAFFATYSESLKMRAILEARPDGEIFETWALYAPKAISKLEDLKDKKIVCRRAEEADYLKVVVLEGKLETTFTQVDRIDLALSAIKAGGEDAPVALLARTRFVTSDVLSDEKNPLHEVWKSGEVAPMLVVAFASELSAAEEKKLSEAFLKLKKDDKAETLRATFGSDSFGEVNQIRLTNARRLLALQAVKAQKDDVKDAPKEN